MTVRRGRAYRRPMPTGEGTLSKASIPPLDDRDVLRLADEHLADLADRQRTAPGASSAMRSPRLRRAGRDLWDIGAWLLDTWQLAWNGLKNPRHAPGSWWAHARLLAPTKTFNRWKLALLVFAAVVLAASMFVRVHSVVPFSGGVDAYTRPLDEGWFWSQVGPALFLGALVALLASLWNDAFRLPYLARRIRGQVRRRPDCILLTRIDRHAVRLVPSDRPIEIVPRTELCDELLLGALQRKRKDVQIVVGDPGAGKTTALIEVARAFARVGLVPVLVPLRTVDDVDLVAQARRRFKQQIEEYVRTDAEAEQLWRWLYVRRRVAILTDDLDRLSPDGERGFVLRDAIRRVQTSDLPIVVTARPAGVPAGIAASAIDLGELDAHAAVDAIVAGARNDPGFRREREVPRQTIERWVEAGRLAEVPYYLELLAQLATVGADTFPRLPEPGSSTIASEQRGMLRRRPDGTHVWNPWWVYFFLLDAYEREVRAGRVQRWLGIEPRERESTMGALQAPALGLLLADAVAARASVRPRGEREAAEPERRRLVEFVPNRDRDERDGYDRDDVRPGVSAHEVVETAERLRILERSDGASEPQFRHRITQAYLAGRRLAETMQRRVEAGAEPGTFEVSLLLDSRHPEKLTAHTTLTFAALHAHDRKRTEHAGRTNDSWGAVSATILRQLLAGAHERLEPSRADGAARAGAALPASVVLATEEPRRASILSLTLLGAGDGDRYVHDAADDADPRLVRDPEARRDTDDALIKLTTAADVAYATHCDEGVDADRSCPQADGTTPDAATQCEILRQVKQARYVTRWTKLNAIRAIAALDPPDRWKRIWQFARDADYRVRQVASEVLERDASLAYQALQDDVEKLLVRAAARSALAQPLEQAVAPGAEAGLGADVQPVYVQALAAGVSERRYDIGVWTQDDVDGLRALATVLPAIASGLREDPALARALEAWGGADGRGRDERDRPDRGDEPSAPVAQGRARDARTRLGALVAIAFQGRYHGLETAVAQGFRADAARHVASATELGATVEDAHMGPGWVAAHARLVTNLGLAQAEHWHAQLALGQALALYAIAGANRHLAYDALAQAMRRGGSVRNVLAQRTMRLARTALRRHSVGSRRWSAYLWHDEVQGAHRRQVASTRATTQLLGDVTVLLDLAAGAQEDRRDDAAHLDTLPYCLHRSRDRREILGAGCPRECGWNLCPYKQPPPDEPNEHRGVSRAFCRQQRVSARRPRWQRAISRARLAAFWEQMERRART